MRDSFVAARSRAFPARVLMDAFAKRLLSPLDEAPVANWPADCTPWSCRSDLKTDPMPDDSFATASGPAILRTDDLEGIALS